MESKNVGSKLKNKWMPGVKTWCNVHKTELIGFGTLLGATIFGACIGLQFGKQKKDSGPSVTAGVVEPEHDYGRNLVMKFFDESTGELYKEDGLRCTEEYAKDMYDLM